MPKELDIKIKDLVISSTKAFVSSFIYEPKLPREKKYGKILAVADVGIDREKASKIFEIITSYLRQEYYKGSPKNALQNFETSLNKINETLASLAQKGEIDWIGKINVSLLCIKEKSISLSCSGKARVYLFREKDLTDISEGVASKSPSPLKTFTNIVSGSLAPQDKLIISTLPLLEVIPKEKIKKTLELPPDLVCSTFKQELPDTNLATLVVEIKKVEEPDKLKSITGIRYPSLEIEEKEPPEEAKAKVPLRETKEKFAKAGETTSRFVRGRVIPQASQIFRKVSGVIEKGKPKETLRRPRASTALFSIKWEEFKKFLKDIPKSFMRLPRTSQIFFIAALILLVLFFGGISALSCKRKETQKLAQYEDLLSQARDKEKAASDALIYKDEKKAKTLLVEAKSLVDEILKEEKRASKKQRQEAEDLLSKIQGQLDKTEHIVKITDPQVLANFEEVEPAWDLQKLVGIKDKVYSFDSSTNTILRLDEENKQLVTLPVSSQDIGHLLLVSSIKDKNKIVFYTDTPAIAELDIEENKLEKIEIEFSHEDQNIRDLTTYLDKVYLLDIAHNQIYKHSRTISGYSRGATWLNKEINLENAQSLAIDGDIWILTSDGTVLKFLTGDLQEFNLETLTKPSDNPTRIITSLDLEYLYIVDPKNKRVVVFDKKGKTKNQYLSDSFDDLKDVYINEAENKMYLLNGKKIYGIELETND